MKAYTDLEQSKKLAEILSLESADMLILNNVGRSGNVDGTNCTTILKENLNPIRRSSRDIALLESCSTVKFNTPLYFTFSESALGKILLYMRRV